MFLTYLAGFFGNKTTQNSRQEKTSLFEPLIFIIGLPVALLQNLKIFGVEFSYVPLNGFLRIFGTLLCSRPTMSFR